MPLFGKKNNKMDLPEVVDFSNDTWSFKGEPPVYQIQSDGFTYDVVDSDGNDKNAISLGLAGMLIIVLNAKSSKIREDELLPQLGKVIKTRNWHSMTMKEANFLAQTAIKKLSNSATSGDVFDLASYAPLDVKRVLLKSLFTICRIQLKPEFREEAEHRIIDDIVPEIFANPEFELAQLTGLIVKPDPKATEKAPSPIIETSPILDPETPPGGFSRSSVGAVSVTPAEPEPDSAFAELQKIYGRKADSPAVQFAAAQKVRKEGSVPAGSVQIAQAPVGPSESKSIPAETAGSAQIPVPNFGAAQPGNPFASTEPKSIPQSQTPAFGTPQLNNPFASNEPRNIPQPPMPNFGQQPNNPFAIRENQTNAPMPNYGFPQGNPYMGNIPPYPGQPMPQYPQMPQNMPNPGMMQQPYPPQQAWQQNPQIPQQQGNYPQSQTGDSQAQPQYGARPNNGQFFPPQQPPIQNQ